MGLSLICPECGAGFPAQAGLTDAEARKALAAALDLHPSLAVHVIPYLGLHAPARKRLAWPKLTRLVTELVDLVRGGEVTRERETRPAPVAAWCDGLQVVLGMRDSGELDLPLDGHALLVSIVWRRANRAQQASAAANRPLHPSHRPAADTKADWAQRRETGAKHIGALLGSINAPKADNPEEQDP